MKSHKKILVRIGYREIEKSTLTHIPSINKKFSENLGKTILIFTNEYSEENPAIEILVILEQDNVSHVLATSENDPDEKELPLLHPKFIAEFVSTNGSFSEGTLVLDENDRIILKDGFVFPEQAYWKQKQFSNSTVKELVRRFAEDHNVGDDLDQWLKLNMSKHLIKP